MSLYSFYPEYLHHQLITKEHNRKYLKKKQLEKTRFKKDEERINESLGYIPCSLIYQADLPLRVFWFSEIVVILLAWEASSRKLVH